MVSLSKEIVAYDMAHNTESEACDLLMEIECLGEPSFTSKEALSITIFGQISVCLCFIFAK